LMKKPGLTVGAGSIAVKRNPANLMQAFLCVPGH
jgi:hypothetical protein